MGPENTDRNGGAAAVGKLSDFTPVAIVTDVHYRMSLALIRDLGEAGVYVITCAGKTHRENPASPALGSLSRYCRRHVWLEAGPQALLELCRQVGQEFGCRPALLPVGAGTLAEISRQADAFSAVAGLLIPTSEQLDRMNDKEQVADLAHRLGVPVPESFTVSTPEDFSHLPFPCVIKPRCGEKLGLSAAQRYKIVRDPRQAAQHHSHFSELTGEAPLIQTWLGGSGLGCSVLAEEGRVVTAIAHRRLREYPITGGPSSCCVSVDPAPYLPWIETMVAQTGYSGLAMFEFKEDASGQPHLLEVNPRIWGTFPLTRVSRSSIPMAWFVLSWNRGNPDRMLPNPVFAPEIGKKMIFCASDLLAALGYARAGKPGKTLAALLDLVNPAVRDGLLEWKDPHPAAAYFRSQFQRKDRP